MKINKLETHDRKEFLHKDQGDVVAKGASDCMLRNPLSLAIQEKCPYIYIFAHPRTADDGVNKRLLWQPRISKPKPQTNSYLFRAISKTDALEIIWIIPPRELWDQYKTGKVSECPEVIWSIDQFENNYHGLALEHPQDLSEERSKHILKTILNEHKHKIRANKPFKLTL